MNYKLLVESWRKFLNEEEYSDIDDLEKDYQARVLASDTDDFACYQAAPGISFEEVRKMMVQLKYMPEDLDVGYPENEQCSIEFVDAIKKAQEDLGFTGDAVDGILGKNTIRRLKDKIDKMAKMTIPDSFTPELMQQYTSVEVKEKIVSQKTNDKK